MRATFSTTRVESQSSSDSIRSHSSEAKVLRKTRQTFGIVKMDRRLLAAGIELLLRYWTLVPSPLAFSQMAFRGDTRYACLSLLLPPSISARRSILWKKNTRYDEYMAYNSLTRNRPC